MTVPVPRGRDGEAHKMVLSLPSPQCSEGEWRVKSGVSEAMHRPPVGKSKGQSGS